ncbi:MAG: PfkB family carbohydrate kinase [Opitutae bacterium]|nr:PfkB family carbohydrate kinase [Opitutae bacterium]MCD8299237.1 PfkB family carbohydrate kinase [Opitutae bacterium]
MQNNNSDAGDNNTFAFEFASLRQQNSRMKKFLVVGIGEILWDVFPSGKKLGGAPANFAFHASQAGADGVAISAIGRDAAGDEILATLATKSLRTAFRRAPQQTGSVQISLDHNGAAQYAFPPDVAWDNIEFTTELATIARAADAICFGTLAQRSPRSHRAILQFLKCSPPSCLRVFDANLRQNFYSEEIIRESLALTTILKINEDELEVFGEIFDCGGGKNLEAKKSALSRKIFAEFPSVEKIVLTCGGRGSFVDCRNNEASFVAADAGTRVVDTVGAGDSFTAAFVVALLRGKSIVAAHEHAGSVAGFVCSQAGGMPEWSAELRAF